MSQTEQLWYLGVGGQQEGPLTTSAIVSRIQGGQAQAQAYVYTQGMASWQPISAVSPFSQFFGSTPPVPPPMPTGPRPTDVIDYRVLGEELQLVEITLDPGEAVVSEAGAMLYMEADIDMTTIFGQGGQGETLADKAKAAGSRWLTGETLAMTQYENKSPTARRSVAFASPYPGKIVPLDLRELGGRIICEKGAFLCAARGVKVGIEFQTNIAAGLLGGEGFILQKLEGDGLAFMHAGGFIFPRKLEPGETLRVDTGCIVGFQPTVKYDVKFVGGITNAIFGGEGLFLATLSGPGIVWLQSLPFSRLAGKVWASAPQAGGQSVGEGSLLGGAGNLAMGGLNTQAPQIGTIVAGIGRLMGK